LRGATFALDRLDERQRLVAVEREQRVAEVGLEPDPEPAAERVGVDAPAFGES